MLSYLVTVVTQIWNLLFLETFSGLEQNAPTPLSPLLLSLQLASLVCSVNKPEVCNSTVRWNHQGTPYTIPTQGSETPYCLPPLFQPVLHAIADGQYGYNITDVRFPQL